MKKVKIHFNGGKHIVLKLKEKEIDLILNALGRSVDNVKIISIYKNKRNIVLFTDNITYITVK